MSDAVNSSSRRTKAARTRERIVEAATGEFRERGFHGATIAAIAKRAGVAAQTVYFVFNNKPALLTASIDRAVMGPDDLPPQAMPWWEETVTTRDGHRSLELFVAGSAEISQRAAALDLVVQAAALTDPDIAALLARHEQLRTEGYREYVSTLTERDLLRPGADSDELTSALLTMTGSGVFLAFTEQHGWPAPRYVAWVVRTLAALYLR